MLLLRVLVGPSIIVHMCIAFEKEETSEKTAQVVGSVYCKRGENMEHLTTW